MSSSEDFAQRWQAAKVAAAASIGAGDDDGPSVALKDSEASLLLSGGLNPQSEPVKAYKIDSPVHSINVAGLGYRSQSPKEGEVDHDYVPEDREGEPIPVTFAALKSAGKKRLNEFAPAERGTKKSKTNIQGSKMDRKLKPRERNGLIQLQEIRYLISACKRETGQALIIRLTRLRSHLEIPHDFYISEDFIMATRILDDGGLPDIANQRGCDFAHDLIADARALIHKWGSKDFDSDLLRGVQYKAFEPASKKRIIARKLEDGYPRKAHAYIGQGTLTNGQWWPLQICLIRDGAHGALESGISGARGGVAHSVVVSNSGYSNIDNGETVQYCGTASKTSIATPNTKMLLESHKQRTPVRLIRSGASKPALYLPTKGLRYDGLYDVTGYEVLDQATAMYRFTLSRQAGQPPIRHTGEGARPNKAELKAWQDIREEFGLRA